MGRLRSPDPILGVTPVSTRDEAALAGRTMYFTGKLCVNGHLDWRYVSTMGCRSCLKPPKPITPYLGEGINRFVMHPKIKVPVLPRPEEMKMFEAALEAAARQWLALMGYIQGPKDPDEL